MVEIKLSDITLQDMDSITKIFDQVGGIKNVEYTVDTIKITLI